MRVATLLPSATETPFACLHPDHAATPPGERNRVAHVDATALSVRADGG
jgi:iron complex transport system substrate-binding protein